MPRAHTTRRIAAAITALWIATHDARLCRGAQPVVFEGRVAGQTGPVVVPLSGYRLAGAAFGRGPLETVLGLGVQYRELLSPRARQNLDALVATPELQQAFAAQEAQPPANLPDAPVNAAADPSIPAEQGQGDHVVLGHLQAVNAVLEDIKPDQATNLAAMTAQVSAVWDQRTRQRPDWLSDDTFVYVSALPDTARHGSLERPLISQSRGGGWRIPMPWLGEKQGYLADWLVEKFVQFTGRAVDLRKAPWLEGPVGAARGIGQGYFEDLARQEALVIQRDGPMGLLPDFHAFAGPDFSPERVDPRIVQFYERTSEFGFELQSQWGWFFHPLCRLLAMTFTRRLQQMNLPLSPNDTRRGIASSVFRLLDPRTGAIRHTAWVRRLIGPDNIFLLADYSLTQVPGHLGPAAKVVFPTPNGNMTMILKPQNNPDGSFTLVSSGMDFGDLGFYVVLREGAKAWARRVRGFTESFHVFPRDDAFLGTVHTIQYRGNTLLRLDYRIDPKP